LRNPEDERANSTTALNIDDLMPKKVKKGLAVQYIVGGRS